MFGQVSRRRRTDFVRLYNFKTSLSEVSKSLIRAVPGCKEIMEDFNTDPLSKYSKLITVISDYVLNASGVYKYNINKVNDKNNENSTNNSSNLSTVWWNQK